MCINLKGMMKMKISILTIAMFCIIISKSQADNFCNIEAPDSLNYGEVLLRSIVPMELEFVNSGNEKVIINSVYFNSHYNDYLEFDNINTPVEIPANSNFNMNVKLNAKQNINLTGILFINVTCNSFQYSLPIYVNSVITVKPYAKITDNKFGADLKNAISDYLTGHTSYSYRDARKLFWGSFDKKDGLVECIYTGKTINPGTDPDFAALDALGFNTEHSWPKSLGAENEPAESDINHLFVSDKTTNDKRANHPFGFVTSNVTYENNGSKLGKNSNGETVFEVRDLYKGNIARAMFYFALRYNNPNNFLQKQEDDLREWVKIDPVDYYEGLRNDSVLKYQNRSNLFIEYPELLERIPSLSLGTYPTYQPNYFISDTGIVFDLSKFDATAKIRVWLTNYSNYSDKSAIPFIINKISLTKNVDIFELDFNTSSLIIGLNNQFYVDIICTNMNMEAYSELIVNYSNGHSEKVNIYAIIPQVSVNNSNVDNYKVLNYPNPAQDFTTIKLSGTNSLDEVLSAKIYDLVHGEIVDVTSQLEYNDNYTSINFKRNSLINSGQVYFVRFELKNKSIIHPILFMN
jgi:hypothetical protein